MWLGALGRFWHCRSILGKKVQVGKDQEKAQSEKDSHSKKPRWEKTKLMGCCIRKWHCRSLLDHCGRAWQTCYRLLSKLITNDYNYFQRLTITIKSIFPGFIRLQLQLICKSNRIINRLVLLLSTVYDVVQYDTVEPYLVVAVGYGSVDP